VFGSNGREDSGPPDSGSAGAEPDTGGQAAADVVSRPFADFSDPPGYGEVIDQIHRRMIQMFAIVEEAVASATDALLTGDRERARALVASDAALDELYVELQSLVHDRVVTGGLDADETTWLLAVLSMLPELERSGDLAEHVAQRATRNLPGEIPARIRGFIERMGELACSMWKMAADAYAEHLAGAEHIDLLDDELDDLHVQFIAELVGGALPVQVAIELALVGRFYERLGDHAVNLTRRVPRRAEFRRSTA
jgi:phosphate transport system protein